MRQGRGIILEPETLLEAYCRGVFPMTDADGRIRWYTADPRGVIPLDAFHIPQSLAQFMRAGSFPYELRVDSDFEATMRSCMNAENASRRSCSASSRQPISSQAE